MKVDILKNIVTVIYAINCLVLIVVCLMQSKDDEGASGAIVGGASTSFYEKNKGRTKEGKLKAVVSITMDDEFVVHDIKVIEGEKGLFIAMPSKKAVDGEYRDIAHPINSGTRERIQTLILNKYEEAMQEDSFDEAE